MEAGPSCKRQAPTPPPVPEEEDLNEYYTLDPEAELDKLLDDFGTTFADMNDDDRYMGPAPFYEDWSVRASSIQTHTNDFSQ